MTRVIHTGDTHVGYRQYHSPERQRDFLAAFESVVADAIADDDVDAVVHAGDLFHDRRPGLRDLQGTVAALRELRDAAIPFLAVVGNHESKRDGQWLDLFQDLGLAERLDHTPRNVGDTAFYGLDYVPRSRRDDLQYDFTPPEDASHTALVSHGLFEPFAHADWDTERLLEEATLDFDAFLIGDNHAPGTERVDGTWVTYCGSTERASASERADRGYNIVEFDATADGSGDDAVGEGVAISRRGLDTREFVFVDVDLEPGEATDRVREAVRQYDATDAVVVVTITGDGDPVTPAPIEELAQDDGALVVRVNDQRDVTTDADVAVTFADPDEAVRERVRELGLSTAARDIDETVRESKIADTNVRDTVQERIAGIVDDGNLDAFEPVTDTGDAEDSVEGTADTSEEGTPTDADEATPTDGTGRETDDDSAPESAAADGGATAGSSTEAGSTNDTASDDDTASVHDTASVDEKASVDDTDSGDNEPGDTADGAGKETSNAEDGTTDEADGQASMEEFL